MRVSVTGAKARAATTAAAVRALAQSQGARARSGSPGNGTTYRERCNLALGQPSHAGTTNQAVPSCAGECRFVRGDSVGNYAADPDLWGFCGATTRSSTRFPGHQEHPGNANGAARRAGPDRGARFTALPPFPAEP